jgi:preprotein translocase subunit YajC
LTLFQILAQTTGPAAAVATRPTVEPPWYASSQFTQLFPILLIVVVFYLFLYKSKKKTESKRTDMLAQLKRGDRVQTIGGILGTVVEARETEVVLKVDEGANTKLRFTRSAIHRVVEDDAAEAK